MTFMYSVSTRLSGAKNVLRPQIKPMDAKDRPEAMKKLMDLVYACDTSTKPIIVTGTLYEEMERVEVVVGRIIAEWKGEPK